MDVVNLIELLVSEVCWLITELLLENDLSAEAEKCEAVVVAVFNELEVWELVNFELVLVIEIFETWERTSADDVVDLGRVVELDCLVVWDGKAEEIEVDFWDKMGVVVKLDCLVVWDNKAEEIEVDFWDKMGVVVELDCLVVWDRNSEEIEVDFSDKIEVVDGFWLDVALSIIVEDNGDEILWTPVELCETVLTELPADEDGIEDGIIVDEVLAVGYGDDVVVIWLLGNILVAVEIWDTEDKLEVDESWVWEVSSVEVVDMKLDSASEIEVVMDVFELLVSIGDDVTDKDGLMELELLVCSGIVDKDEAVVLAELAMSDGLCIGMDDSDGLTTLKLLEPLVCSGTAAPDRLVVIELSVLVISVEVCRGISDTDGLIAPEALEPSITVEVCSGVVLIPEATRGVDSVVEASSKLSEFPGLVETTTDASDDGTI